MAAGGWNWLVRPARWLGRRLRQWWRYAIALGIIVVAVIASLMNWFTVCEVIRSAKDGTTTTCAPPDLTQASVLAVVALVLALLWPDLHEITAFGVTIKKLVSKVDAVGITTSHVDLTTTRIADTVDVTQTGVEGIEQTLATHGARLEKMVGELNQLRFDVRRWPFRSLGDRPAYPARGYVDRLVTETLGRDRPGLEQQVREGEEHAEASERIVLVGTLLDLWRRIGGPRGARTRARSARSGEPLGGGPVEEIVDEVAGLIVRIADGRKVDAVDLRAAVVFLRWLRR